MTDLSPSPSSITTDTMTCSSSNLEKIESYFNTSSYRESLEISATFNSRLSMERRHRLPFLDPQTGVAQRHCNLYMKAKQRLPGLRSGQMYSFPATRWRKPKRQYLANMMTDIECVIAQQTQIIPSSNNIIPTSVIGPGVTSGGFLVSAHDDNSNSNASFLLDKSTVQSDSGLVFDNADNSRDTNNNSSKEEILQRDWIYDDMENDFDTFSEPKSPDDEYDYDPRYGQKKRGRKPGKKEPKGKKGNSSTSAFGSFDFNSSTGTGTTTTKSTTRGRAKESGATSTPKKGEPGTERRTRRKNAGTGGKKKFIEPPSFESAAAGFEDLSYGSASGAGWM